MKWINPEHIKFEKKHMQELEKKYWREWILKARQIGSKSNAQLINELATIADDEQREE